MRGLTLLFITAILYSTSLSAQTTKELFSLTDLTYVLDSDIDATNGLTVFFDEITTDCNKELLVYSNKTLQNKTYLEILDGKVSLGSDCNNLELRFDFDLEVGEQISAAGPHRRDLLVKEKKIIQLLDGLDRRQLLLENVNNPQQTVTWIEGIGDINLGIGWPNANSSELRCVSSASGNIYLDNNFSEEDCKKRNCRRPVADFEISGQEESVELNNLSELAETYMWDLGDGTTSTEESPSHTYEQEGCYIITLVAENSCGEQRTIYKNHSYCVDSIWTLRNKEENFSRIAFGSEIVGLATGKTTGNPSTLYKSTDGSNSWTELQTLPAAAIGRNIIGMEMQDENNAIVYGADGNESELFITEDGGDSWREVNFDHTILNVDINGSRIVAAALREFIYISDDGGLTWAEKILPAVYIDDIQIVSLDKLVTLSAGKSFSYSEDGGDTWTTNKFELEFPSATYAIHFFDELSGVIGGYGAIMRTEDGGLNWDRIELPLKSRIQEIKFLDAMNGWATGSHIWRTEDGGQSWSQEYCNKNIGGASNNNNTTGGVEITPDGVVYINLLRDGVYKHTPDPDYQCSTSTETFIAVELRIFPNPAYNVINVETAQHKGSLDILDSTGKQHSRIKFSSPLFDLNIENLPAGVYFLRLTNQKGSENAIKFVKI